MKKFMFIITILVLVINLNTISHCDEIDNEIIDVNAEIETSTNIENTKIKILFFIIYSSLLRLFTFAISIL